MIYEILHAAQEIRFTENKGYNMMMTYRLMNSKQDKLSESWRQVQAWTQQHADLTLILGGAGAQGRDGYEQGKFVLFDTSFTVLGLMAGEGLGRKNIVPLTDTTPALLADFNDRTCMNQLRTMFPNTFKNIVFDYSSSKFVDEHEALVDELASMLKPGGTLYYDDPQNSSAFSPVFKAEEYIKRHEETKSEIKDTSFNHRPWYALMGNPDYETEQTKPKTQEVKAAIETANRRFFESKSLGYRLEDSVNYSGIRPVHPEEGPFGWGHVITKLVSRRP